MQRLCCVCVINTNPYLIVMLNDFCFPFSTIGTDVIEKTTNVIREAASILSERNVPVDPQLLKSAVEYQIDHALSKSPIINF